ncbi:MAG: glycosyltransferase [Armatimonadota bacterium]
MREAISWPLPSLEHLCRLTDECGVLQHAKFWSPDYAAGYCADDNSRALIVAHRYYRLFHDEVAHELMVRYLAFLFYTQRSDGKFRNFIDYSRNFLEEEGSPDCQGRSIWGLGHLATLEEDYLSIPAREMFHHALKHVTPDSPPHAQAYAVLGLCTYGERDDLRDEARRLIRPLAATLHERYRDTRSDGWDWFLPMLTYGNGRLPQSLLGAGDLIGDDTLINAGLHSLDFLNAVSFRDEYLSVVGCHGWYPQGGDCALFDQQPIDAGAMVEVNLTAYRITRHPRYLESAKRAMDWFFGNNLLRVPLYNPQSKGCHDGLQIDGVNSNQGAESLLAYLMAGLLFYETDPSVYAAPAGADARVRRELVQVRQRARISEQRYQERIRRSQR